MAVCRVVHGPHADGSGECHVGVASMGRLPKRSAFVRALDARAPRGGEPFSLGSSSRVYDILEGGGAVRTRSYPARLPHYSTVRAHHRNVGPKSGHCVSHTHNTANADMVVKGWSVGSPLDGGSRRLRWRLMRYCYPKDDASSFLFGGRFTHAALLV